MSDDRWIIVHNWERFQYRTDRPMTWIQNHVALTRDPDYLALNGHLRAVLHGVWMEYAGSNGRLPADPLQLSRRLSLCIRLEHLRALKDAGFLEFSGARPAPLARARDKKGKDKKLSPTPFTDVKGESDEISQDLRPRRRLTAKQLRGYTGCRWARGTHSSSWVRDPLGRDRPPADWPYPPPEPSEIEAALEEAKDDA
jgi:hypothetical protein